MAAQILADNKVLKATSALGNRGGRKTVVVVFAEVELLYYLLLAEWKIFYEKITFHFQTNLPSTKACSSSYFASSYTIFSLSHHSTSGLFLKFEFSINFISTYFEI